MGILFQGARKFAESAAEPHTEESRRRLAFCKGDETKPRCPQLNVLGQCTLCSCFVEAKVKRADQYCPRGLW